jgi:hypothetical protein
MIGQITISNDWLPRMQICERRAAEADAAFEVILETAVDCDLWAFEEALHASLSGSWPELQTEVRVPWEHRLVMGVSLPRSTRGVGDILRLAADILEVAARQQAR